MLEPKEDSSKVRKKIVVFCGHPCAGKTYISKIFQGSFPNFVRLEMDDLRKMRIPGTVHDKSRRDSAYRIMHHEVTKALHTHLNVAVVATYYPSKARAEIAEIARRFDAELYVVQCVCEAQVAVDRFLRRLREEPEHAGTDLCATRVRDLANQYERFDGGLTIETTNDSKQCVIHAILHRYISSGPGVDPCSWAQHWYSILPQPDKPPSGAPGKLSEAILKRAWWTLFGHRLAKITILGSLIMGGIPLLFYIYIRLSAEWLHWTHGRSVLDDLWNGLVASSWPEIATGTTFTIAAAGIIGIFLVFYKETKEKWQKAKDIVDKGSLPVYNLPDRANETPSDREVYYAYQCRMKEVERVKMPIPEIPVYFLIPPQKGKAFGVIAEKAALYKESHVIPTELQKGAAKMALDWEGFAAGRWNAYCKDYALNTKSAEKNLRCVGDPTQSLDGTHYTVPGHFCPYNDYAVRELSVNLCAPGTLPDMRRLFEGPAWDEEFVDLSNLKDAARRYSMRMSVTGLLLTNDDFFVLQRRSSSVASGVGSLGASVGGAVDFCKDALGWRRFLCCLRKWNIEKSRLREFFEETGIADKCCPSQWNLKKSLLRELREETGIADKDLRPIEPGPFIGAAFNLRYGRDLNFYALLNTNLCSSQISAKRDSRRAHDRWEVDHLEFLHCERVTVESIRNGVLQGQLPDWSRHLLGALYAWAVYKDQFR
jgi:8-oxo-dGTP pyrophosphatase MutT (NUDIX family)/predicted kinase